MVASRVGGWTQRTWGCSEELFAALSSTVDLLRDLPVQVSRLGSDNLDRP